MAMIDSARFTALKARVQAECLRRKYNGSVVDYGGPDYYFTNEPAPNTIAAEEHFEKLAVPLNAINSDDVPYVDGDRIISDEEMTAMEAAVTLFETRAMTDRTQGDCKTSCTGACYTGCAGSCTGGCGSSCSGTCTGGCDGCSGCSGSCRGGCRGCGSGCASGCSGTCTGTGKGDCTMTCGYAGCVGSCMGLCYNGCTTSCGSSCSTCGNTCSGISL